MSTALLVMTNGRRDMLVQTLESFREKVAGDVTSVYVNDDSADPEYADWLGKVLPPLVFHDIPITVRTTEQPNGFGGAIRNAWKWLQEERRSVWSTVPDFDWIFHLEDDFTFNYTVDLIRMQGLLIDYEYLAQMALKRQPWGGDYEFANGFMEQNPGAYIEREDDDDWWVETRRNWTTNPSLYRADLLDIGGWPEDPHSEGKFGFYLKEHGLPWGVPGEDVHFGILGRISDPPLVHHIGGTNGVSYRVGHGY